MAIIFNNKKDYRKITLKVHPDKAAVGEIKIANQIMAKINLLYEEAETSGYPFEYVPEKDEYCF